ncbi:hypothetical protein BGX29_010770 [Mortierella sp. GBA35]|nr:hypothetical protein BGX29_010770 [Mortierella sp. GBA35]
MTVDDSEMQRLWKLTNELTAQLVFNRSATLELKQQLAELQAQTSLIAAAAPSLSAAEHGQNGQSGRESQGASDYALRIANERLREENLQLQEQVNEYERWMGYIMTKFRLQNLAMAQTRKESMQEASKMAEQGNETAHRLQEENSVLQARLADLGTVARKAIHEEYYTTESLIESLETENRSLREMLGVAEGGKGPVSGRLDFFVGRGAMLQDEDDDEEEGGVGGGLRMRGSRVSFPSTAGSIVASSESDHEQQQPLPRRAGSESGIGGSGAGAGVGSGRQSLSPMVAMRNSASGLGPLTVQTGLQSPTTTPTTTTILSSLSSPVTSSSTPSRSASATSPTSPSWSSSTSASSSALASPTFQQDASRRLVSVSPPLDPPPADSVGVPSGVREEGGLRSTSTAAIAVASLVGSGTGSGQQKNQRGKMTINTKLGGHGAGGRSQ